MKKKLIKIGLTGGYGSGKSFVSSIMAKNGCLVIDADDLAHHAIEPKKPAWKKIVSHFGSEVVDSNGLIDRKKLAGIVFNDKRELAFLDSVIHPVVIKEIRRVIKFLAGKISPHMVVVSAPLLIEAGLVKMCDKVIVIKVKKEVQLERCRMSKGENISAIKKRISAQMPISKKLKYADYVIDNNGLPQETEKQVIKILKNIINENK